MNRVAWDVRHSSGLAAPPGTYQARLTVGNVTRTQPFTVLIDPRVAAGGVTKADLKEQFDHNMKARDLLSDVNKAVARVRAAQRDMKDADAKRKLDDLATHMITPGIRYSKPEIQTHIQYLYSMTTQADQISLSFPDGSPTPVSMSLSESGLNTLLFTAGEGGLTALQPHQ